MWLILLVHCLLIHGEGTISLPALADNDVRLKIRFGNGVSYTSSSAFSSQLVTDLDNLIPSADTSQWVVQSVVQANDGRVTCYLDIETAGTLIPNPVTPSEIYKAITEQWLFTSQVLLPEAFYMGQLCPEYGNAYYFECEPDNEGGPNQIWRGAIFAAVVTILVIGFVMYFFYYDEKEVVIKLVGHLHMNKKQKIEVKEKVHPTEIDSDYDELELKDSEQGQDNDDARKSSTTISEIPQEAPFLPYHSDSDRESSERSQLSSNKQDLISRGSDSNGKSQAPSAKPVVAVSMVGLDEDSDDDDQIEMQPIERINTVTVSAPLPSNPNASSSISSPPTFIHRPLQTSTSFPTTLPNSPGWFGQIINKPKGRRPIITWDPDE